ncbi:MAG: DUF3786 domain-containing protein [Proteobacteria bacterium]|nr:DUF3786 domain-containing protein [Pseudomonadota bacterium]
MDRLAGADYRHAMMFLGARDAGEEVALDVLGRTCLVGPGGVRSADQGPLDFTVRIVVAYYILHGGSGESGRKWVSYRDFKDGAFFHATFSQIVENKIATDFSGRPARLRQAGESLGCYLLEADLGGDICLGFPALPRVPLALVFYDADEDFPASARVLFDETAPRYLDMECLAVLGLILADQLPVSG